MEDRSVSGDQISASEDVHGWPNFHPRDIRLNIDYYYFFLTSLSGVDTNPWIQIDFITSKLLTAIIVQGGCIFDPCSFSGWVTSLQIQTGNSTSELTYIMDHEGNNMVRALGSYSFCEYVL